MASLVPARGQGTIRQPTVISVNLSGVSEQPPNDSPDSGTAVFSYDVFGYHPTNDTQVRCTVFLPVPFSPTSAGIYGPADADATGALIYDLGQPTLVTNVGGIGIESWPPVTNTLWFTNVGLVYSNTLTLTPQQMEQFNAGLWYVDVSSLAYPEGELRGQINGVAPPHAPLKATYNGLFAGPTNAADGASGSITLATTLEGKCSGNLRLGPARYTFSGSFDTNGHATVAATSGKRDSLVLSLYRDAVLGTEKLVGSLRSTDWVATVTAYRAAFDGRSSLATDYVGQYTMLLPASGQPDAPSGYGFARLSVSPAGQVAIKGSLADGTAFSQSVPLSRDGHFPLYASLYANRGFLSGWMACTNQSGAELEGQLLWVKPNSGKGLFPGGFTSPLTSAGGRYTMPAGGAGGLSATNSFIFGGNDSTLSFTNTLVMERGYKLLNTSTNRLHVALRLSKGTFSGSAKPPGSARNLHFQGALWQNCGWGYFLDASESGWVLLQP